MGDTETALFQGQTAWFSTSVLKRRIKLWKKHGGLIAGIGTAQFVFSEDEEAADTKQIFCSEAYINEHLAVFHAMYVSDSAKQKNRTKIPLGDYFLPPKDVQQLIKKQKKFKWEDVNDSDEDTTSSSSEEEEGTANHSGQAAEGNNQNRNGIQFDGDEYVDIQMLTKVTGHIVDFVPGKNGCEVSSKNKEKT